MFLCYIPSMFRRGEKLDQGIMFVVQWPTKGGVNEGKNVFFGNNLA